MQGENETATNVNVIGNPGFFSLEFFTFSGILIYFHSEGFVFGI